MDYKEKQLRDLKTSREQYLMYLESINQQIEEIEKANEEQPEIGEFVGKFFLSSFGHNQVYVVLGPALDCRTKKALPNKVEISHLAIDTKLSIYKGNFHMELSNVGKDIEITKEEIKRIRKYWLKLSKRGNKKINDIISTFKEEMMRYSKSIVGA